MISRAASSDVEVKRSHFLTELCTVSSEEEAMLFIEDVRKRNRDARHNCFAMRIGAPGSAYERYSDDGEPQGTAGKPMLDILKGNDLYDVVAVVTRYFGGTLLGTGGLVRAYSDSLKAALEDSELSELMDGAEVSVLCEYKIADRIKYLASTSEIFTVNEIYTDKCELHYLVPLEKLESFTGRITEMSSGSIAPEILSRVQYYGKESPIIYKRSEEA